MEALLGLLLLSTPILLIWYINHLYLKFKIHRVIKIFRKHPLGVKLIMLKDDAFTYYDRVLKGRCHNREYIYSTSEENIRSEFRFRHCDAILSFPLGKIIQWEKDFEYLTYISDKYPNGLFKYIVDNKIIESWDILPNSPIDGIYLERYTPENLQRLACVDEKIYRNLDIEENEIFNIPNKKCDSDVVLEYIKKKGIKYIYHTTHKNNIESIINKGGLYSWVSCNKNGINIEEPGGDILSRQLDVRNGVADYVHLSFRMFHPMFDKKDLNWNDYVTLKIHPVVLLFEDTLFSTENATSNNTRISGDSAILKDIDYYTTQLGLSKNDPRYGKSQAEVLVKKFVPLKYILNLNQFKGKC